MLLKFEYHLYENMMEFCRFNKATSTNMSYVWIIAAYLLVIY